MMSICMYKIISVVVWNHRSCYFAESFWLIFYREKVVCNAVKKAGHLCSGYYWENMRVDTYDVSNCGKNIMAVHLAIFHGWPIISYILSKKNIQKEKELQCMK